ncbi:hypothetical protein [Tropicimonas sp. S265A]|uniref:hypothetical protein n=1 Tax=Tropicimonas sp. S265A TaxID=3415134 RepID=UPI003C7A0107
MPHAEITAFVVFAALMSGVLENGQPLLVDRTAHVAKQTLTDSTTDWRSVDY